MDLQSWMNSTISNPKASIPRLPTAAFHLLSRDSWLLAPQVFPDEELDHNHVVPAAFQERVLFVHAHFSPAGHAAKCAAGVIVSYKSPDQFEVPFLTRRGLEWRALIPCPPRAAGNRGRCK